MMITFVWRFRGRGGDDALLAALATLYISMHFESRLVGTIYRTSTPV